MAKYDTAKLRNLGIIAHGGAGKTSLAEAILFDAGRIDRLGRVDDGTSTMDYEPEEIKRKISITSSLDHCEWNDHFIHIVDTPGYGNFIADTRACMRALDCAVVILSAISGVKAQTEEIWQWANEFEIPRIAFVNKMDRERANFFRAIDDMEKALGARGVAIQIPLGAEENFEGVIDLVRMKAYRFAKDLSGKFTESDIPGEYLAEAQRLREQMVETVAEAYDALTEKFLDTGELTEEEILDGLRVGTMRNTFTAVLCGSATMNIGVPQLLDAICSYLPSPLDRTKAVGINPKNKETIERAPAGIGTVLRPRLQDHLRSLHRQDHHHEGLFRRPQFRFHDLQFHQGCPGADRADLRAGGEKAETDQAGRGGRHRGRVQAEGDGNRRYPLRRSEADRL